MTFETIEFAAADGVARIALNRPDRLNALNTALLVELRDALETAASDQSIRAVLLTANGRAFCSGADLKEGIGGDADTAALLRRYYHPVIAAMRGLEKPLVAAVQGLAAGAGASLALAADLVVAAKSAAFQQIFTNIGLVPDAGSSYHLPRLVGHARALGAMLTGEAIEAERAERWGLIWQAVADERLTTASHQMAAALAQRPTRALGLTKTLLAASASNTLAGQMELEADTQTKAQQSADFAEAVQAFLEKRPPHFTGQ